MSSDHPPAAVAQGRDRQTNASFVAARWWQAADFISLSVEIARGRDPYADQFLAHPRSLASMVERGYLINTFFHSSAYFIEVAGRRAGVVWLVDRPGYVYIYSIGLLPEFQRSLLGMRAAQFVFEYGQRRNQRWGAGCIAAQNRPVRMLMAAFKGRRLGLSTTSLPLLRETGSARPLRFEMKPLGRASAKASWTRWRLHEVEHVAGRDALHIARHLLENLPRGKYVAVCHERQEIGFAFVRRNAGEPEIGLFTSPAHWSDEDTACIVDAIEASIGMTARRLTLTRSHADTLTGTGLLKFDRRRDEERYFVVFRRD